MIRFCAPATAIAFHSYPFILTLYERRVLFREFWPFAGGFTSPARRRKANFRRILADTAATILEAPRCRSVHLAARALDSVCDVDRISSVDYRDDSRHLANCIFGGGGELCRRLGSRLELLQCRRECFLY